MEKIFIFLREGPGLSGDLFLVPGKKGGYIFSYKDDKLELKKAVAEISARRALYKEKLK
ncbi:MAG: hypothetical protein LR000_01035 [Candidatus Pacebacteria bacterium]|nr:hypothetical protein [Candidatus Paceibacterota bacterium]